MTRKLIPVAALFLLLASKQAQARSWQGVTAGVSTQQTVVSKFGSPHKIIKKSGKCAVLLNYQKSRKIRGTNQANFCFDSKGILIQIAVFPDTSVTRKLVEEAYGSEYKKKLTDQFREYYLYPSEGMAVFWSKDGKLVDSILFTPSKKK